MDELGTITKYYPFISQDTKSILGSLMEESSSYFDFVQRLCTYVVEGDVPVDLIYLAAVQAWWTRAEESMKRIQERYKDEPCIRPWAYSHTTTMSDQLRSHDSVVAAIDEALETSLIDWMEIELHFLHAYFHYPSYGDVPSLLEPLEKAKNLMDSNPRLVCYQPLILMFEGHVQGMEEHLRDAIVTHRRGLELAQKNDDKLYMHLNLEPLATKICSFDIQEALDLFQEMYDLAQDMGVPYMITEVLFDSLWAFEFAGEYDLAISSLNEAVKTSGGYADDTALVVFARIYATLGDGQLALEYANQAFEDVGPQKYAILYLRKAWALALLNRVEEAEHNLNIAHSMILKTGKEMTLGVYYHVAGAVELARGDYQIAMDFLEKSHEIMDRFTMGYLNIVLLDLARVEILMTGQSRESKSSVTPGRWLSKLERYAIDHDLPGIRMQAAMLKSELYQNHNQLRDAVVTLEDALSISDSLGVKTLRKMINDRIRELNHLLREEAGSSKRRRE